MSRPRLLDLFCGAGGAALGYHRAGFEVVGVDINPQPNYPFEFHQGDALEFLWRFGQQFDARHASPPCQAHSALRTVAGGHSSGWLLPATRHALSMIGGPYVIENVVGADMPGALLLCGKHFGLSAMTESRGLVHLRRHRLFESNIPLAAPGPHPHPRSDRTIGVYGNGDGGGRGWKGSMANRREAMGIDWMTRGELSQAIPPAYCEFIGRQLLDSLRDGGNFGDSYRGGEFEYHVIEIRSAKLEAFAAQTGIELEAGCGIDTAYEGYGSWHGVKPQVEIVTCDFPTAPVVALPEVKPTVPHNPGDYDGDLFGGAA